MNENKKKIQELTDADLDVVAGGQICTMPIEHTCDVAGCEYTQKKITKKACLNYSPTQGDLTGPCRHTGCACGTNGNCENGEHK